MLRDGWLRLQVVDGELVIPCMTMCDIQEIQLYKGFSACFVLTLSIVDCYEGFVCI